MISSTPFHTDSNQQELFFDDPEGFPYICFYRELTSLTDGYISWHWHPALEIDYVEEGEVEFRTPTQSVTIKKGELIFINSNIIHGVYPRSPDGSCKIYAQIFNMEFLGGTYNSCFTRQYILPVTRQTNLQLLKITPDHYHGLRIAESFLLAVDLSRNEPFGYEFLLRNELSKFWILLFEAIRQLPLADVKKGNLDSDRLKLMLTYIHQNYSQHITLNMIAASANISSRECTRCFQRCMQVSPVSYLNRYRIQQAARQLLNTSDSILTVSENCGFSSGSYFGKLFHSIIGCSPKEYRKQ